MARPHPDDGDSLDTIQQIERALPVGRDLARYGIDLDDGVAGPVFHEAVAALSGDDQPFDDDLDGTLMDRICERTRAAYAIGVATGLHLNLAAFTNGGGR